MKKVKSKRNELNKLTKKEVEDALDFQTKFGWTFYSERELLENAISEQVNFVVAAFAIFIAATVTVEGDFRRFTVLAIGSILLGILTYSTQRVFEKWKIVLGILYRLDEPHVFQMVQREFRAHNLESAPTIWWRAVAIPGFCFLILFTGSLHYFSNFLKWNYLWWVVDLFNVLFLCPF